MMKENKKIFSKPELDIIKLTAQDIIATSGESYGNESGDGKKLPSFDVFG